MNSDNPKYKAIETIHSGYRFRSRLEARWAIFFETLGIEYRYEPEGFDLGDGIRYLPDFYLPRLKMWIEIKPSTPTPEEREKAIQLCIATQNVVTLLAGDVWHDIEGFTFSPHILKIVEVHGKTLAGMHNCWLSKHECIIADGVSFMCGFSSRRGFIWSTAKWVQCDQCNAITIHGIDTENLCSCQDAEFKENTTDLMKAFTAARQARFSGRE